MSAESSIVAAADIETWLALGLIGILGFVLGFAMNHGSICTVIATTELVTQGRPGRFIALAECALWAAIVYTILDKPPTMQGGWSPLDHLVVAAALFGLGMFVNGACVFGSVGHFGNGDMDFGFTFLGMFTVFYLGAMLGFREAQMPVSAPPPIGLELLSIALLAFVSLRFVLSFGMPGTSFRRLMVAMAFIGVASAILSVFAPRFSITTSLGSMLSIPVTGSMIFVCMFGGSLVSARLRKRQFLLKWPTLHEVVKRTLGGALMGSGALLIPGGNDTLLLVGLPMGAWQAAIAYLVMVAILAVLIARFGTTARAWS